MLLGWEGENIREVNTKVFLGNSHLIKCLRLLINRFNKSLLCEAGKRETRFPVLTSPGQVTYLL